MKHTIRRIEPLAAAKVLAIIYGVLGLIFAPILLVLSRLSPDEEPMHVGLAFAFPFLYAILGFIITLLVTALYNVVAGWLGGIVVELEAGESA